jgi:hypothetical protein
MKKVDEMRRRRKSKRCEERMGERSKTEARSEVGSEAKPRIFYACLPYYPTRMALSSQRTKGAIYIYKSMIKDLLMKSLRFPIWASQDDKMIGGLGGPSSHLVGEDEIPCGLSGLQIRCLRQRGTCQDTPASEGSRLTVYYVILVYFTAYRSSE